MDQQEKIVAVYSPLIAKWLSLKPPLFSIVTGTLTIMLQITVIVMLGLIIGWDSIGNSAIEELPWPAMVFTALFLAPLLETLLAQTVPILITSRFTSDVRVIVGISALIFSALHLGNSPIYPLFVLLSGIVYAYGYLHLLRTNRSGYWPIAWAHAIHNGWAVLWIVAVT